MNTLFEPLGLRSPDGRQAQLLSVQLHAEVLGLMLRLTLRQTWRNTSGAPMATRWTFPLGAEQCLLGLQVQRPSGVQQIERSTRLDRQACSVGFGVMGTGEQVTLEARIGQLMAVPGGSLRLALPAALVPPAVRPARVSIELHAPLTQGTAACTSHELQRVRHANGMTLQLHAPHGLERELALTVHGLRETGFAMASPHPEQPGQCTVLAGHSLQLPSAAGAPAALRLKLVFDHSAAIGQERLAQLRVALERLIGELRSDDQLAYSSVGQQLAHELPRLQPCTEAYVRRARSLMRHTPAEAAQTDWTHALRAVAALCDEDEAPVSDADVLLVTGQALPPSPELTLALRSLGHRLHVLAVGEAVGSAWPELARASGGHCEGLAPGQHGQQALQRLLARMRSLRPVQASLSLHGQPLTPSVPAPTRLAEGDTLQLWATAPALPGPHSPGEADLMGQPQWQAQLHWQAQDLPETTPHSSTAAVLWDAAGDLARLCQALQAQLQPALPEAAPPAPVGSEIATATAESRSAPAAAHTLHAPHTAHAPQALSPASPSTREASATVLALRPAAPAHPLAALVQQFNQQAPAYQQFRAALSATLQRCGTRAVDGLVMHLARQAGNPARVWALLLHHLHADQQLALADAALALVEGELASLPLSLRQSLHAQLRAAAPGQRGAQTAREAA